MEAALNNSKPYGDIVIPDLPAPNGVNNWLVVISRQLVEAAGHYDNAEIPWLMTCLDSTHEQLADSEYIGEEGMYVEGRRHRWDKADQALAKGVRAIINKPSTKVVLKQRVDRASVEEIQNKNGL